MFSTLDIYILIITTVRSTMLISGMFYPLDYTPFESRNPFSFEHSKPRIVPGIQYLWHTFQRPQAKARMGSGPLSLGRLVRALRGEGKKREMSSQREGHVVCAELYPPVPGY